MNFLVVDDDFVTRSLMNTILSRYGICDIAISGEEAVYAYKKAYKEGVPYQALFLDIMMPGNMDGLDALKEIRQFELDRDVSSQNAIKVIMVSSVDEPETVMSAFRDQCDSYIFKPVNLQKVIAACKNAGMSLQLKVKPAMEESRYETTFS